MAIKNREPNMTRIGWIINEEAAEPVGKTSIVDGSGRRVVGEGVLQRANKLNRNKRFYDDKDLFPQVTCPRTKELLATGFGSENGHPMDKDLMRQQTIDPNNVVAFFTKLWTDGDYIKANFVGSNLPIGEAFDLDLRDGRLPAWSLRALGTVVNTARGAEVKDIKAITWDRVYYPSHPEAYTTGILTESGILVPESSIFKTPVPMTTDVVNEKGEIIPIVNQDVLDCIKQESFSFNRIVESFDVFYNDISIISEGTQVQLVDKESNCIIIVNLESFIHNEIMNYCTM